MLLPGVIRWMELNNEQEVEHSLLRHIVRLTNLITYTPVVGDNTRRRRASFCCIQQGPPIFTIQ